MSSYRRKVGKRPSSSVQKILEDREKMKKIEKQIEKKEHKKMPIRGAPTHKLKRRNINYDEAHEEKHAKEEALADEFQKLAGGRGQDVRSSQHTVASSVSLTVPEAVTSLGVRVFSDASPLYASAVGLAAQLVKRGGSTSSALADSDISCWKAALAWYGMLVNIQKGEYPSAISIPTWMWNLLMAMCPKNVPFKTGELQYAWSDPIYDNSVGLVTMKLNGYFYSTVFGYLSTGAEINGYPTVIPSTGITDSSLGVKSLTTLLTNFPSKTNNQKTITQPENNGTFSKDVSAMSMVFPEIGTSGLCDTGGLVTTIYSEKTINHPLLSGFTPYQPDGATNRGTWNYRKWGTSPTYQIGRLFECNEKSDWSNKLAPFVKFYNFDEYWIQLNYILSNAIGNLITGFTICPLSAQAVQILLRQELLRVFSNDLAFDLRLSEDPFVPIIPFQVGNNGAPTGNGGMRLPRFFVESVRAVKRHVSELKNGTLVDYVPVLGRPIPTVIPQLGGFAGLFTVPTNPAEEPVDLIDLKASPNGNVYHLTVGGEKYTAQLNTWNNWINGLQSCLTGLCTIGAEGGICALQTNVWSTHAIFMPETQALISAKQAKKGPSKKSFGNPGIEVAVTDPIPDTGSAIYKSVYIKQDTCVNPMYAASFKYVQCIVKPIFMSMNQTKQADPTYLRSLYCETNVIQGNSILQTINDCEGSPTLYDRLGRAAQLDVKAPVSDSATEMETDMDTLAAEGRGGFFTGLASMFGKAIGVPEISNIADAVGGLTGL